MYLYEREDWPAFQWDPAALLGPVGDLRYAMGRLAGGVPLLARSDRERTRTDSLVAEMTATAALDGLGIEEVQLRSLADRALGTDAGLRVPISSQASVVGSAVLGSLLDWEEPVTEARVLEWLGGPHRRWRDDGDGRPEWVRGAGPGMEVLYVPPKARRISGEMAALLSWFERPNGPDWTLRAGVAMLWVETLQPLACGSGILARTLASLALARAAQGTGAFSLSSVLFGRRQNYEAELDQARHGALDITAWLRWFLQQALAAVTEGQARIHGSQWESRFWLGLSDLPLSGRQRAMLRRLLERGEGRVTSSQWARRTGTSPDTALRDILQLVEWDVLERSDAGGRSTSYRLRLE